MTKNNLSVEDNAEEPKQGVTSTLRSTDLVIKKKKEKLSLQIIFVQSYEKKFIPMGQVFDKLRGKEWRKKQVQAICDRVFDRFKIQTGRANLTFEELYIAVLLVYNDINKRLPGPHFDPPSKDLVKSMMTDCDLNLDGEIDRDEFVKFIEQLSGETFAVVSQGLIISLVVAPTVAIATKKATEGVPGVGKVVQKLPTSIYASLVTLAVVWATSDTS